MPEAEPNQHEPTVQELAARTSRLEQTQRDQWGEINATRDRVAAAEAGMNRLWSELHSFRTESREDSRQVTQAITDLGKQLGTKADHVDQGRIHRIENRLAMRHGALRLIAWIVGVGVPAIAALAGAVYYVTEIL